MNTIEKRQKRAAVITEARAILNKADGENRSLTPEEKSAWDGKMAESERMKESIEIEERQAKLEAENAAHVGGATPPSHVEVTGQRALITKGQGFLNMVRAIAKGRGDERRAAEYAEQVLHDPDTARALSAGNAAGGGFAVPTTLAEEFIEFLRPASVVRSMEPRILPMPNGNMTLPRIQGGAVATWIGENSNIGATQQTLGQVKLTSKKLAALVPISNDLIRYANPQTDGVIRADLVAAVSQAEDLAFLRGDGTQFTPKGMKNWASISFPFSGTADIPTITSALGTAISNLLSANIKVTLATGAWFFSPRTFVFLKTLRNPTSGQYAFPEMQGTTPTLLGYKVAYTSQIPTNLSGTNSEAYFANMADVIIGEGANLILDVSSEAAYVDASGATISAFSQDQTVIRVIEENDFATRYEQAVTVMTAVSF